MVIILRSAFLSRGPVFCDRVVPKDPLPAQLSSAIARQRSAVLRRASPYYAVLFFVNTAAAIPQVSREVPGTGTYACTHLFPFFVDCLSRPSSCYYFFTNNTRTTDQKLSSPASTQHSTGQPALHK